MHVHATYGTKHVKNSTINGIFTIGNGSGYTLLQIRGDIEDNSKNFSYFSTKTYLVTIY